MTTGLVCVPCGAGMVQGAYQTSVKQPPLGSRGGVDTSVPSRQRYRLTLGSNDILKVFSCRCCGMPAASGLVIGQYLAVLGCN